MRKITQKRIKTLLERAYLDVKQFAGEEKAYQIFSKYLLPDAVKHIQDPQALLAFSLEMIQYGGFISIVGRSLKMEALLAGATLETKAKVGAR